MLSYYNITIIEYKINIFIPIGYIIEKGGRMKTPLNNSESNSISIDGIVDVSGGKGVTVERTVSKGTVLRGQILMGQSEYVRTADANISIREFAGVAMNKGVKGKTVFVMVKGLARMVIHKSSNQIYPCDNIASAGQGMVSALWSPNTFQLLMAVRSVGDGYVDCEINCQ